MPSQIVSHIDAFNRRLEQASERAAARMVTHLFNKTTMNVGRGNPRNRKTGQYDQPSKPGESPKKRTGFGQQNIRMELDGKTGRVGILRNAIYMLYLELGARLPARTMTARRGKLMIPFRGTPTPEQIKKIGLKKIHGTWVYFRQSVKVPASTILPRPWLVKTLREEWSTLALLAKSELKNL